MPPVDEREELEGASNEAPDDSEAGPIELPAGASCRTCHYVETHRVPGPSVIAGQPGAPQEVFFCRRFPPNAVMVPTHGPNGPALVMQSQAPPVSPDAFCFEYDAALPDLGGLGEG